MTTRSLLGQVILALFIYCSHYLQAYNRGHLCTDLTHTQTHADVDTGSLLGGKCLQIWVKWVFFVLFFLNLYCVLNTVCRSGINGFKSFSLSTLDALDFIHFMFDSARFTAHPGEIKGSFNICNGCFLSLFGCHPTYVWSKDFIFCLVFQPNPFLHLSVLRQLSQQLKNWK